MAQAAPVEGVDVVALGVDGLQVLDLELGAAGQHRRRAEVAQIGVHGGRAVGIGRVHPGVGVGRALAQADGAGALVALVVAVADLRLDQPTVVEAALPREGAVAGAALVEVAGHAVVVARVQRQHGGVARRRVGGGPDPRQAVVDAVAVVQVEQGGGELVALADAPAVRAGDAAFADAVARAVVADGVAHHVDPQGGAFADVGVEVAGEAQEVVIAHGEVDPVLVHQARHLADLVDRAARGAAPEQHRGRAADDLDPVEVEGVPVVETRVTQHVHENVAGGLQRVAAQADVFFATFGGQERDAGGVLQHLLEGVEVAVVHQFFGDDGDRLRDVAQVLGAPRDAGARCAQAVATFFGLGLFLDGHGGQGLVLGCGRFLCERAHRTGQQHRAEREQGAGCY